MDEVKKINIIQRIQKSSNRFSRGQKLIANFIINKYDKAAFMTAAKLGDAIGVSESTVVRFATEIGYEGYPELQKALQELVRNKLTSVQRIEVSSDRLNEKNLLRDILISDSERIKATLNEISVESFDSIVNSIVKSNKIYILGARSAYILASFLWFNLNFMFENVILVNSTSTSEIFEQIYRVCEGDTVFTISFPRYSKKSVKAVKFAKDQGATVITMTDSYLSPLAQYSDQVILANSDMFSFVDSLVAPLSVINALIVAVGTKKKDEMYKIFNKLEKIWDEYEVFEKNNEGV